MQLSERAPQGAGKSRPIIPMHKWKATGIIKSRLLPKLSNIMSFDFSFVSFV